MRLTVYIILGITALPVAANGFIWWCKAVARWFNISWAPGDDWGI